MLLFCVLASLLSFWLIFNQHWLLDNVSDTLLDCEHEYEN